MTALDVFAIVGIVSVPATLGLGAALWAARAELRARRENDRHQVTRRLIEEALVNSRQLESTVDTMAIELERLAESQRFVARLLSERIPVPANTRLPRPGREPEAPAADIRGHGAVARERVTPLP